jgi:hypothetical protein
VALARVVAVAVEAVAAERWWAVVRSTSLLVRRLPRIP